MFATRGQTNAAFPCFLAALQCINASLCWITLPYLVIYFAFSSIIHRCNTPVIQRSEPTSTSHVCLYETGFPHMHYVSQTDTCSLFAWCSPICLFSWILIIFEILDFDHKHTPVRGLWLIVGLYSNWILTVSHESHGHTSLPWLRRDPHHAQTP